MIWTAPLTLWNHLPTHGYELDCLGGKQYATQRGVDNKKESTDTLAIVSGRRFHCTGGFSAIHGPHAALNRAFSWQSSRRFAHGIANENSWLRSRSSSATCTRATVSPPRIRVRCCRQGIAEAGTNEKRCENRVLWRCLRHSTARKASQAHVQQLSTTMMLTFSRKPQL